MSRYFTDLQEQIKFMTGGGGGGGGGVETEGNVGDLLGLAGTMLLMLADGSGSIILPWKKSKF